MVKRDPLALTDPYAAPPESDAAPSLPAPSEAAPDSEVPSEAPHEPVASGAPPAQEAEIGAPVEPAGTAGVDEPAPPARRGRSRRRSRRILLRAFAVLGILLGLGAALVGLWVLYDRRSVAMFPDGELGTLPDETVMVSRFRADRAADVDVLLPETTHPEAVWSNLAAQICGGEDVFDALMGSTNDFGRRRAALAIDERRATAKALACGRHLASRMGRGAYTVRFLVSRDDHKAKARRETKEARPVGDDKPREEEEEDKPREPPPSRFVNLYELSVDRLPEAPDSFIEWRERAGLVGTRCSTTSLRKDSEDCKKGAHASARLEGSSFWVAGTLEDIELFGRRFSPNAVNGVDHEEDFIALAELAEPFPRSVLGTWESFDGFIVVWELGLGGSFRRAAPAMSEPLSKAVHKRQASWAVGHRRIEGDSSEVVLWLLADSSDDAAELALDLKDWHSGAKEVLDAQDEKLDTDDDSDPDMKRSMRRYLDARASLGARALRTATIEREDRLVTVVFTREPTEEEHEAHREMTDEIVERRDLAAKVVRQLLEGDKPDEDLLRDIGGRRLVDAVEDPEDFDKKPEE